MLYNKSTGMRGDVMSLDSLIGWLEQQPAKENYTYESPRHCLIARYLTESGVGRVSVGVNHYTNLDSEDRVRLPKGWNSIAIGWDGKGHTFGAALKRAIRYRDGGIVKRIAARITSFWSHTTLVERQEVMA